jgi:hypothetical protein
MGTTVLDSGIPIQPGLHVYAHGLRDKPGGVALLVINTDRSAARTLHVPVGGERYTLSVRGDLESKDVQLNDTELKLGADDGIPALAGVRTGAGDVHFDPATITFLALPDASNNDSKQDAGH